MKRLVIVLAALVGVHGVAGTAQAIPSFADRYGVGCHLCHRSFPKLTKAGQRFKERGFRMEKEDAFDLGKWAESVPVRLRASGTHFFFEGEDSNSGIFKILSAGNLGKRLSYWVDDSFFVTEGDDKFQHLKPDNAWARIDVLEAGKLYVRGGRMEMDIPFTQTRTPHLFSYDVYFQAGSDLGSFREGIELGGYPNDDLHWSAAVVDGAGRNEGDEFDPNAFLRLSKRFEANRVGAFAYVGKETDAAALGGAVNAEQTALLLGADLDTWFGNLNLHGVGAYGRVKDTATVGNVEISETTSYTGAFLQADYHVRDSLALTARGNLIRRPVGSQNETFSSFFPGIQFWILERARLSFEYGFTNKEQPDFGAVQAEIVF